MRTVDWSVDQVDSLSNTCVCLFRITLMLIALCCIVFNLCCVCFVYYLFITILRQSYITLETSTLEYEEKQFLSCSINNRRLCCRFKLMHANLLRRPPEPSSHARTCT